MNHSAGFNRPFLWVFSMSQTQKSISNFNKVIKFLQVQIVAFLLTYCTSFIALLLQIVAVAVVAVVALVVVVVVITEGLFTHFISESASEMLGRKANVL